MQRQHKHNQYNAVIKTSNAALTEREPRSAGRMRAAQRWRENQQCSADRARVIRYWYERKPQIALKCMAIIYEGSLKTAASHLETRKNAARGRVFENARE